MNHSIYCVSVLTFALGNTYFCHNNDSYAANPILCTVSAVLVILIILFVAEYVVTLSVHQIQFQGEPTPYVAVI